MVTSLTNIFLISGTGLMYDGPLALPFALEHAHTVHQTRKEIKVNNSSDSIHI